MKVDALVRKLKLKPHPEGGFYAETYRSAGSVAGPVPGRADSRPRSYSTAIYFLLPRGAKSRLHRIKSDEAWHFHLGGPLKVTEIAPDGKEKATVLGADLAKGQRLQYVVRAGAWFGAEPLGGDYSLVGCTVAPGFDFEDFELADRATLLKEFPKSKKTIVRLTGE